MTSILEFNDNTIGALEFTVSWTKDNYHHEEWFLGRKFNAVNDIFPRGMREALEGKNEGESVTLSYEPRMCIPRHKESQVRQLDIFRLRKKTVFGTPIIPKTGRFYPQGHINGLADIYPDTLTPFRLIGLSDDEFIADCNHPLAQIPITIDAKIQYLEKRDTGTYGSLTHWREKTCDWGPGMQAMFNGTDTDFSTPDFYCQHAAPLQLTPPPMDQKAAKTVEKTFARFIQPGMRLLDASLLTEGAVTGTYDAATALQVMEYVPAPAEFMHALSDKLTQGAPVVFGFTSHFHPDHVIHGWTEMHEFERMGYILQLMRQAGLDSDAGTISIRNDWRNKDDLQFLETRGVSDPVFIVYGHKR